MKLALTAVSVSCLLILTACSNPKDASESNFTKAAQDYLDTQYPHCYFTMDFPYKTGGFDLNGTANLLHAIAAKNIVTETEVSRKKVPDGYFSGKTKEEIIYSYALTDTGKKYYKKNVTKYMDGHSGGGFCFGKATVSSVGTFTEPSSMMGQTISRVNFSYKVTDIPDWAKDPKVEALNGKLTADIKSTKTPVKKTNAFVLTNKGWIHERLFRQ